MAHSSVGGSGGGDVDGDRAGKVRSCWLDYSSIMTGAPDRDKASKFFLGLVGRGVLLSESRLIVFCLLAGWANDDLDEGFSSLFNQGSFLAMAFETFVSSEI